MSTKHAKAAGEFLKNQKMAAWHDETLWMVRAKRDKMSKQVPEWEHLRDMACALKCTVTVIWTSCFRSLKRMLWQTVPAFTGQRMPTNTAPLCTISCTDIR